MSDSNILPTTLPTVRVAATAVKSIPPEVAQRLTPGAILDVTIQRSAEVPHGILVDGTFVSAAIPPDLNDAQEVSVQVIRTTPAIVLRVVSLDPTPLPSRPSTLLDDAFRILLSGEDLTTLRESFRGLERPMSESLRNLTAAISANRAASDSLHAIARHLAESRDTFRVLDDETLEHPERVLEALERIFSGRGLDRSSSESSGTTPRGALPTERINAAILAAREIPLTQKTLERLREEISKLLTGTEPLTFGEAELSEELSRAPMKDLASTARSLAIAGGRSHSFADLIPRSLALPSERAPIIVFLRALGSLSLELARGESPLQRELGGLMRDLVQALNRIPPGAREDVEIRAALTHAAQKLEGLATRIKEQTTEATLLVTSADISREIDRVNEGQEILRTLAPVARSLGEPIAMFIPAVVHGLLTKFEFSFYPAPQVDESTEDNSDAESSFFERVDMRLPLPTLGSVHIAVARRPGEALINLTCETAAAHAHLLDFIPKLEDVLARLGYERRSVAASVGATPSAVPEWCRNVTRSERIA